jgi:small subunit ribosomal protein S5
MTDELTPQQSATPAEPVTPPATAEKASADPAVQPATAEQAPAPNDRRGDARTFRIRRGGPGGAGGRGRFGGGRGGPRRDDRRGADIPEMSDYEEKTLEINRVTRVTKGGKRMRFRVLGIVGNRKGRVGYGIGKAVDVQGANLKAFTKARKALITVPIVNETIPHEVRTKFSSASILIKPAPKGTGVKAGGAVRQVLALAGVPNVISKILGSSNKVNNVKATMKALKLLRTASLPQKEEPAKREEEKAS